MRNGWAWCVGAVMLIGAGAALGQTLAGGKGGVDGLSGLVTTDRGAVGSLLRRWAEEGTAAGNVGDLYDNRDRGHSQLDTAPWPQLGVVRYSPEERASGADWAVAKAARPGVVFGNSSTSSSATVSGSNTRLMYAGRSTMDLLYDQYTHNNLYLYPAHQDHSPGHDGFGGGYGDLFPANTAYVITSQGSSGSDQPFMKAVAFTLGAFRPEVKRKLASSGTLMATVQMVFRMSNRQVTSEGDYLSGKAHPTVFDGSQVDVGRMVALAHSITMADLPPVAKVEIAGVEDAEAGKDYFDPYSETLGNTPGAIARVYRGMSATKRIVVSGAESLDLNGRELTYRWVLLRGEASKVKITPLGERGAKAEIVIGYHERGPISAGAVMESNRVDVGLFVSNGKYWSAPAFVTSFSLDSEGRTYDQNGRLLEVGYGMAETRVKVGDWGALFEAMKQRPGKVGVELMLSGMSAEDRAAVEKIGEEYLASRARLADTEKAVKDSEERAKKASGPARSSMEQAIRQGREALDGARRTRDLLVTEKQPGMAMTVEEMILPRLKALAEDPIVWERERAVWKEIPAGAEAERKRLIATGIVAEAGANGFAIQAVMPGTGAVEGRLTRYQRERISRFNGELLAAAIPGVQRETRENLVDFRLTIPKRWRDVYHYDAEGRMTGWTRFDGQRTDEFTADGAVVVEKDVLGRATVARGAVYERNTPASFNPAAGVPDATPLTYRMGSKWVRYGYADEKDRVGRVVGVMTR